MPVSMPALLLESSFKRELLLSVGAPASDRSENRFHPERLDLIRTPVLGWFCADHLTAVLLLPLSLSRPSQSCVSNPSGRIRP